METEPERDGVSPAPAPQWSQSAGSNVPPPPPSWSSPPEASRQPAGPTNAEPSPSQPGPTSQADAALPAGTGAGVGSPPRSDGWADPPGNGFGQSPPGAARPARAGRSAGPGGTGGAARPGRAGRSAGPGGTGGAAGPGSSGGPGGGPPWAPPPPTPYRPYGYRRFNRPRGYRRSVSIGWRGVVLALGVVTLGFAWLAGAVVCWVAFFRTRRQGELPGPPGRWLRWALVYSVLGLIVVPLSLNAAINGKKSGSSSTSTPPLIVKTVPLGTPVAIRTSMGTDLQVAPATVTATAFHPAPATGGTATVDLKVCATSQTVDPSFAADSLELETSGFNNLVADTNLLQASNSFGQAVPAGHCTTGPVPFSVPANTDITSVQLPSLYVGATWTLG